MKSTKHELAEKIANIKANNWISTGDKKEYERAECVKSIYKIEMRMSSISDMENIIENITIMPYCGR
jgi:ABC-type cobalamin/Fe3+-siderophores transport system ATPase subunit